mmetsp:Transcript_41818/g.55135  ORF Transcript_41818/g.55135 Transcript_41818/m.55135 type:complete len:172 (+) Transcript_41818:659-1174(+)
MCFLNDTFLFVIGSYVKGERNTFSSSCERYDIKLDRFAKFPSLNTDRCHHSSCSFDARFIFVFCGSVLSLSQVEIRSQEDRGMTFIREEHHWQPSNSIGRFESSDKAAGWATLLIPLSPLTPRRTPGVVQVRSTEILIFGEQAEGAGAKVLKASYRFDVHTQTITKYNKLS